LRYGTHSHADWMPSKSGVVSERTFFLTYY
jgi:hypothetical protein